MEIIIIQPIKLNVRMYSYKKKLKEKFVEIDGEERKKYLQTIR